MRWTRSLRKEESEGSFLELGIILNALIFSVLNSLEIRHWDWNSLARVETYWLPISIFPVQNPSTFMTEVFGSNYFPSFDSFSITRSNLTLFWSPK